MIKMDCRALVLPLRKLFPCMRPGASCVEQNVGNFFLFCVVVHARPNINVLSHVVVFVRCELGRQGGNLDADLEQHIGFAHIRVPPKRLVALFVDIAGV